MLVVRAYTVMGRSTLEITCCGHGEGAEQGGHLLMRSEFGDAAETLGDVLRDLRDFLELAHSEWVHGELDESDDCALC